MSHRRKHKDAYISLFYCPNHLSYARLGVSISRVKVRHAVTRNRLKRVIRDSFRLNQSQIKGYDIVAVAYKGIGNIDNSTLRTTLERLWEKLITSSNKL